MKFSFVLKILNLVFFSMIKLIFRIMEGFLDTIHGWEKILNLLYNIGDWFDRI
jgi:hypothetical protein